MQNELTSVLVLALFVLVSAITLSSFPAGDVGAQWGQAETWCEDDHDGELVNSMVIGDHGGLHCEFENGTTIHMDSVNLTASG